MSHTWQGNFFSAETFPLEYEDGNQKIDSD